MARFIPIYMGQILEAALIHSYVQVHPRIHGADVRLFCFLLNIPRFIPVYTGRMGLPGLIFYFHSGSSPRLRGGYSLHKVNSFLHRLIPM